MYSVAIVEDEEIAVKEGQSRGLMTSFNRIGLKWTGGDYRLLTEILRDEWGFKGTVICDFNTHPEYMFQADGVCGRRSQPREHARGVGGRDGCRRSHRPAAMREERDLHLCKFQCDERRSHRIPHARLADRRANRGCRHRSAPRRMGRCGDASRKEKTNPKRRMTRSAHLQRDPRFTFGRGGVSSACSA